MLDEVLEADTLVDYEVVPPPEAVSRTRSA
jgi:hypothetical protein